MPPATNGNLRSIARSGEDNDPRPGGARPAERGWQRESTRTGEGHGVAPMPAGHLLHASHGDQTPTGFTAVRDAAGVRQPHLVKIVPLRVCRGKTFGTITPSQVRRGDGQMAVATAELGVCLPHKHELAMRAGAHRM